jgi:hypothetical protein
MHLINIYYSRGIEGEKRTHPRFADGDWMRLDSALKKSRPQYISAQKISTLFDALDEREIAR